jgi:4-aminobutyrate aminotransferase
MAMRQDVGEDRAAGGGAGEDLLRRDAAAFFNQASTSPCPMAFDRGEGAWVESADGFRCMDWYGNNSHNLGYRHPAVVAAARAELDRLCFVPRGYTAEPAVRLAERLAQLWTEAHGGGRPGGEPARVSLVPGGSEAVEIALQVARVYTGRFKTIAFHTAYHGRSAGALSVSAPARGRSPRIGPLVPGAIFVPPFHPIDGTPGDNGAAQKSLEAIRDVLTWEGDVAALIAEPIRNGPFVPPEWYWAEVRALCDRHGVVLIFDEVPTGLGRTGRLFTGTHFDAVPDVTVVGKSLGGTIVPLAAVIADGRLNCAPDLNLHYYTHEKNPLTAAVGLATLDVLVNDRLPERAAELGPRLLAELQAIAVACPLVGDVRGIGMMLAVGFRDDPASGRDRRAVANAFVTAARNEGVVLNNRGEGFVCLAPPLVTSDDDLAHGFESVRRALGKIAG